VVFLWSDPKYALGWYGGYGWCEYAGIRHDGSSAPLAFVAIFTEFFGAIALIAGLLGRIPRAFGRDPEAGGRSAAAGGLESSCG
jgi:hypothetical protein